MIFDAKIIRTHKIIKNERLCHPITPFWCSKRCSKSIKNTKTEQRLLPNYTVLVFKSVSKTVIFRKILDGDPTKIVEIIISGRAGVAARLARSLRSSRARHSARTLLPPRRAQSLARRSSLRTTLPYARPRLANLVARWSRAYCSFSFIYREAAGF